MDKNEKRKNEPTIAPGIDNDEELEQKASPDEVANGDTTEVTTLSLDDLD